MTVVNLGHSFKYEMESLAMMFSRGEKVHTVFSLEDSCDADYVVITLEKEQSRWNLFVKGVVDGKTMETSACIPPDFSHQTKNCERTFGILVYKVLSALTGVYPQWGILTGIRPVKLMRQAMDEGMTETEIRTLYGEQYLVSEKKLDLALQTAYIEKSVLEQSRPDHFSLYISIPYCPTRCKYCSFVSHAVDHPTAKKLIPEYVQLLCEEIRHTAQVVKEAGLTLSTIYFGGGTPTSLSAEHLKALTDTVAENFDVPSVLEYTVEAGRPDTITREKLQVLKNAGVTRISINPQTLNDEVLRQVGRSHTAQDVIDCFHMARQLGFDNINMDLIAGLPGDTLASFEETIAGVTALSPENITVHTLSVKRSSHLVEKRETMLCDRDEMVGKMVEYAQDTLLSKGYEPYYLYRQKSTVANLENTGYGKAGYEGYYNIFIMDESHTIVALGAGGVSKLCQPHGDLIERIFNFKYPYEYVTRFPEVLKRKEKVTEFYERYHS